VSDLIDTTEMYLRTIYELEEEGIVPLRARIAERIGHSGPTVSQTVARMERDGLLEVSGDRHLELTAEGRLKATRVMRKHRLAERVLLDVIGLEWALVHGEACRWEHVMSDQVERKLLELLADPAESPYGNPIPGLVELASGADSALPPSAPETWRVWPLPTLADVVDRAARAAPGGHPVELTVRRLGELVQSKDALLAEMQRAGLRPGRRVVAWRAGTAIRVRGAEGEIVLADSDAQQVFVQEGS
jgi:DtxR family Mn-dependent transcriptional regulator